MIYLIQFFALVMILLGLGLLVRPATVMNVVGENLDTRGLYVAAVVVRLLLGAALIQFAPRSAFPLSFYILGSITLAAAIAILVMGRARMTRVLRRGLDVGATLAWLVGLIAIGIGAFLIFAVL